MLSTENPPPDPPCPCEISQLKSSSSNVSSDERASYNNPHQLEVDLCKSGLDDDNNPLPKFSIRDYVFNTRGKDIKNHWPFSPKNLQLCLKHGVKDVLPPFQTLDSVRNSSTAKCAAENISDSDVKLSGFTDHPLSVSSNNVGQKVAVDSENTKSSGSEEGKEIPSTTTCHSCSDINSVPIIKSPYLEPEAENLPGSSAEAPEFVVPPESNKVESSSVNPAKKCRLVVKLSNVAEPKSNEELSVNTSVVSETMASKVCPVCKTFSSSSNTTLNAHIDQCLSGESTIKWIKNSQVIKHRIKPRKTRLMVDIYATALRCTLEDLDRRNGTNWASNLNSGYPVQDLDACAEEKNNISSVNGENNKDTDRAVYFDSNGTKLRILSKFSDLQPNKNAKEDCGPGKFAKGDKDSKHLSNEKKKHLVRRYKLLKCPPHGESSCSPSSDYYPKDKSGQERKFPPEEDEKDDLSQPSKVSDQMKADGFGMIKQWVGSKRTGLKKKINMENKGHRSDQIMKNSRVKSDRLSVGHQFNNINSDFSSSILSDDNPLLSTDCHKRKESSSFNSNGEYVEQTCLRKREGSFLLESQECRGKKNHLMLSKCNHSKKDGPSVHKRCTDPPNSLESNAFSKSNKKTRSMDPAKSDGGSLMSSRMFQHSTTSSEGKEFGSLKKTSLDHAILSGHKKLSSLGKNLLAVRHASVSSSKKKLMKKLLDLKKPRLHQMPLLGEEIVVSRSAIHGKDNQVETLGKNAAQVEKASHKLLINGAKVLKNRKKRSAFVNNGKGGNMSSMGSETSTESDSHVGEKNIGSSVGRSVPPGTSDVMDAEKETEIRDEFVCEPTSKLSDGEDFMTFGESLDSQFPGLAGPSDVEMGSQHYVKAYEENCPADRVLGGGQVNFCADKVGKCLVTSSAHLLEDNNASDAQGNYFVDVDPISIPGPPGSFLPSPGHMGSEELQGNSSLTTCRVLSSEDEHELIDMDSSDSPISATSFASNSVAARSDSVSFANLSLQSHGLKRESQQDMSNDKMDPGVESSVPLEQTAGADGKPNLDEPRGNLILPGMSLGRFKNSQPCCCSRKEGVLQSGSFLNYHDSELLRRRSMTSVPPLPSQEKLVACDPKNKPYSFNLRSESLPEKEPNPEAEKVIANSSKGYGTVLVSHNSEAKFPNYGDCESPSPSTSNSVLRLMGKNLMVVNKEDNLPPQIRHTQSSMVDDHPGLQSNVGKVVSTGSIHNEHRYFKHALSQGPSIYGTRTCMATQCLDFGSPDASTADAKFRTTELSPHPSRIMLSSKSSVESFTPSLDCHEYAGRCNFTPGQLGSMTGLNTPVRIEVENVRMPIPHLRTTDSSNGKFKEIIFIDDSPDNGVHAEAGGSSVRISASRTLGHDSRHLNPYYGYQTQCFPPCSGSQMVQNQNIQLPPPKVMSKSLVTWNHTPGGSKVARPASLTASSPSTGHLRSSLYFSPGFSLPKNFT